MAIRPVDLQLAYMAGPQSAAQTASAQAAPSIAQQSAAASFAAAVSEREEKVAGGDDIDRAQMRTNADRDADPDWTQDGQKRRHRSGSDPDAAAASDGEIHFIDTSA